MSLFSYIYHLEAQTASLNPFNHLYCWVTGDIFIWRRWFRFSNCPTNKITQARNLSFIVGGPLIRWTPIITYTGFYYISCAFFLILIWNLSWLILSTLPVYMASSAGLFFPLNGRECTTEKERARQQRLKKKDIYKRTRPLFISAARLYSFSSFASFWQALLLERPI